MIAGLYGANAVLVALREIEQHGGNGPGDRPAAARSDLLGARTGSRDLPAHAEDRAARRQPLAQHRAAQRVRDQGRPLHLDLGLDPDHGGAAVPRDRPRRHDRRSALPHQHGSRAQHRRMRPRRSPNSSRRARSAEGLALFEAAEVTAAPVYEHRPVHRRPARAGARDRDRTAGRRDGQHADARGGAAPVRHAGRDPHAGAGARRAQQ